MIYDSLALDQSVKAHREYHRAGHFDRVIDQCVEEMAELTKELMKNRRVREKHYDDSADAILSREMIEGEIMDVLICIEFISRHLNIERLDMCDGLDAVARQLRRNIETGAIEP